jgi:L-fuculose-phosphate aldolase
MHSIDLTHLKVITLGDVQNLTGGGSTELVIWENAIVTPSARLALSRSTVRRSSKGASNRADANGIALGPGIEGKRAEEIRAVFYSTEAEAAKAEIVAVGRKLWQRHYVDGNGGNISHRIGPNAVICTPTLVSKADLEPNDLCMVDLEGNQLIGSRRCTSEILLHLEIYKSVPEAQGVVHCHPPHATAYAITGHVPPPVLIPEFDVFIGRVAVSPYETPGTKKFAETVLPYAKEHNTILLANHGIVCWADSVTHAEWFAEVVDTYCLTVMLAAQLNVPINRIPPEKELDLLAIKRKLGLPDVRFAAESPSVQAQPPCAPQAREAADVDPETVTRVITEAVVSALAKYGLV